MVLHFIFMFRTLLMEYCSFTTNGNTFIFVVLFREVIGSGNDNHILNYLHNDSLGAFYFYGNNVNL